MKKNDTTTSVIFFTEKPIGAIPFTCLKHQSRK